MKFGKMLKAIKKGKRVRLPEMPPNYWVALGDVSWGGNAPLYKDIILVKGHISKWESLRLCWRIIDSNKWVVIE